MSWRKHWTHNEETKAVKAALRAAGIRCKVGHGTGTAWAWLHIEVEPRFEGMALQIAKEVTGRTGDYDGEINVHRL